MNVEIPGLSVGSHVITAYYAGDDERYLALSVDHPVTVQKLPGFQLMGDFNCPPTPGVFTPANECMPNAIAGQPFAIKAPVASGMWTYGSMRGPLPTGNVDFFLFGKPIGSAPLVDGVATLTYVPVTTGVHWIAYTYAGDHVYEPATSSGGTSFWANPALTPASTTIDPTKHIMGGDDYRIIDVYGGLWNSDPMALSTGLFGTKLNAPIVGATTTPSRNGYWMVASDGGIFAFGDAKFYGSMGGQKLNRPVISMLPSMSGNGYLLLAEDGGIFTFGDAPFRGTVPMITGPHPQTGFVTVIR